MAVGNPDSRFVDSLLTARLHLKAAQIIKGKIESAALEGASAALSLFVEEIQFALSASANG